MSNLEPRYQGRTLDEWGEWMRNTCLHFGTTLWTAYIVAGFWIKGLERDMAVDSAHPNPTKGRK